MREKEETLGTASVNFVMLSATKGGEKKDSNVSLLLIKRREGRKQRLQLQIVGGGENALLPRKKERGKDGGTRGFLTKEKKKGFSDLSVFQETVGGTWPLTSPTELREGKEKKGRAERNLLLP